ncbi:MAG TPA: glycosyltransferase, partial [Thermoanaerobaculia bacterium]|nr:glycosyltransferase [Thermoanaerobaculia bacterium]
MPGTAPAGVSLVEWLLLLPVIGGSIYSFLCLGAMAQLRAGMRRMSAGAAAPAGPPSAAGPRSAIGAGGASWAETGGWPAVSMLKPVYGLGRDLGENLRTACRQDYPDYQVVFSAQREDEPALPLVYEIQRELGSELVTVVVDGTGTVPNGKARNLLVGQSGARHDLLVVSDADVRLRPDYLKTIVAPLADPAVGCSTTFYKACGARRWYEALEQLFVNADWVPNLVFAHVTGASPFVLGASNAVRRSTL